MSETLTAAGLWVLRNSFEGSVLIVLLATVAVVGGHWLNPRWQAFLWTLAGLRLVLPVAPTSGWSVFGLLPMLGANSPSNASIGHGPVHRSAALDPAHGAVEALAPAPAAFDWALAFGVGWAAGVVLILGLVAVRQWRAVRRLASLPEPNNPRLLRIYGDCLRVAGLAGSRVRLAASPHAAEIAVIGLLRARRIVVPTDMTARYPEAEIRGILLHELAHIRRRDLPRNWLALGVVALHWFNPLVWWAASRLRAERELICDAIALRGLHDRDRAHYGRALIRTVEAACRPRFASPALAPSFTRKSELKRRLAMTQSSHHPPHPLLRLVAVVAAIAAIAVTLPAVAEEDRGKRSERRTERHREREVEPRIARADEPLDIYLNKRGPYIHGKQTPVAILAPMVRKFGRAGVVLSAERDVPHENVVRVLEAIREGGAADVRLAVPAPRNDRERNARRRAEVGKEQAAAEAAERAKRAEDARMEIERLRAESERKSDREDSRHRAEEELRRAEALRRDAEQELAEAKRRAGEAARRVEQARREAERLRP